MNTVERLNSALAGRYRVERELGAGGMAVVYLARDLRHDRLVAIKVLRPELMNPVSAQRFPAEIRVTAKLQHPAILPLHDSGEADGIVYYVMPYVEGESLRELLAREGRLPVPEALRILTEVADALAYAHDQGVVHRDIKPENILLSRGHAVVADFGVAKALDPGVAGPTLTGEGLAVGTPAYMAPEQATGTSAVGPAADLYALGLVAFETLTGGHPFTATTPVGMIAAHIGSIPPKLGTRLPGATPELERLVQRLLAKPPAERPTNAAEVRDELRAIAAGGSSPLRPTVLAVVSVLALIVVLGVLWSRRAPHRAAGASDVTSSRSLAILPLTRIGGDSTEDYFGAGIADELISTLGRVPGLRVASRTSSFAARGKTNDLKTIGQELNVQTVLEGSIQRALDRVRVIVRLVDVRADTQLWSGTYDGTASDVFAMQDSVVKAISGALRVTLVGGGAHTTDPMAHDLFLRGRDYLSHRTAVSLNLAVLAFGSAIERDSGYAAAYAGLATAYAMSAPFAGMRPREVFPLARAAVDRALMLDSTSADAHMARAVVAMFYEWDWKTAEAEFQRSIALNPNDAETHLFYCWYLTIHGRMKDARAQIETAERLDPLSIIITTRVGTFAWFEKRYDVAIAQFRKALALDSTFFLARVELPAALLASGDREAARAALPAPDEIQPGSTETAWPAWVRVTLGDTAGARETLRALRAMQANRYVARDVIAMVLEAVGDRDGALDELEHAEQERAFTLTLSAMYPPFSSLKAVPRYQDLLRRLGLPGP